MSLPSVSVVGSPITALPFANQVEVMLKWANNHLSKVVCVANVHMLTEARWSPDLKSVLAGADLVTPDGMPLVWMMRLMGVPNQDRVAGMDILLQLCQTAPQQNVSLFFLGSQPAILESIEQRLKQDFPNLQIAGMEPLPFRPMTQAEDEAIIRRINESGAGVVLVSLGCPKQELWMAQHKNKVQAVMVGLGGVFPVYAGIHKRAPLWVRELGLEWFYRLLQEPRRLWGRYSKTIPPFVWMAVRQLLTQRVSQHPVRE